MLKKRMILSFMFSINVYCAQAIIDDLIKHLGILEAVNEQVRSAHIKTFGYSKSENFDSISFFITECRRVLLASIELMDISGGDFNILDSDFFKYLESEDFDKFSFLVPYLKFKNKLDIKDSFGRTLLVIAIQKNQLGVAQLLIGAGANLDIQDCNGRTALMEAIKINNLDCIELLIRFDASIGLIDYYGKTESDMFSDYKSRVDYAECKSRVDFIAQKLAVSYFVIFC